MEKKLSEEAKKLWEILMEGVNEKPKHINPNSPKTKKILDEIKNIARKSEEPTDVVFGTSGWRGIVGASHTLQNMVRVTEGAVSLVKNANKKLLKSLGVADFSEFKKRGVVVGRDNRILGEEFAAAVIGVLQKHGIKTYYAGEAPTPEYSAAVVQLNAALSINLTPSHNPGCYAGYKINPADGGPAGEDITIPLEKAANSFMTKIFEVRKPDWKKVVKIDSKKLYLKHIKQNIPDIIDVNKISKFINSGALSLAIDHVHGASRGRPFRYLKIKGNEKKVKILNNDDNILFHGIKPEPNAKNMKSAEEFLKKQKTKFKLGALIDPDGDRIRFTNGTEQIDMNNFGALAFHFLATFKDVKGGVSKTVATSNFINSIASGLNRKLYETNVGFKNFRRYLKPESDKPVICAFEESDGFSIGYANILEKDAFGALMLALEIIRVTELDMAAYLRELKNSYGIFEADKTSVEIPDSLSKSDKNLKISGIAKLYNIGDSVKIQGLKDKRIADKFPDDGIKFEFSDKSNLLIRASGTEPIIKIYAESPIDKNDASKIKEFGKSLVKKFFVE
ncbi:MAG TPA: phosphomannomutase [bacterium]|nr:phosphomannomutase [bacterium]